MNATHATAAAAGGLSASAMVIVNFAANKLGITLDADVVAASMVILTPVAHVIVLNLNARLAKLGVKTDASA